MKKYILLLSLFTFSLPVFAVCSITGGACSATSNWEGPSLQEKYAPDRLKDLQKTDAFKPNYFKPYHNELINTDNETMVSPEQNSYNSNCQFGVCLPGVNSGGDVFE